MHYTSFSLNGAWQMSYTPTAYTDTVCPQVIGHWIENAVPGYWEDMTRKFAATDFFRALRINPEYGIQEYPLVDYIPDMALPNVVGNFFYRRTFSCADTASDVSIHFGGVQNAVSVWINGVYLGRHEGYSTPFEMPIPSGVLQAGENTVVLSLSNHRLLGFDGQPVSGLTSRAANECTGGITGNVELRAYHSVLRDVFVTIDKDLKRANVQISAVAPFKICWSVRNGSAILKEGTASGDFSFDTDGLETWSPEHPKLYTLTIEDENGSLEQVFGVRRLLPDGVGLQLNGTPYYLRGVCEHCYFPLTVHPDHDYAFYRDVIRKCKELGFNYIRCHTFVPEEEYLRAADELGMLFHVECPNNTTLDEWRQIVRFCRRHPSVVIYCCGNELQLHEQMIAHLEECAKEVHANTDALFSPMSALRGFEYAFEFEPGIEKELTKEPFTHHARRFSMTEKFCDLYNSYTYGQNSYLSHQCDPERVDAWSKVYKKPRLSHEICIDGTYIDLSLKDRYKDTRVGKTAMFTSVERHLESKGLLQNAPLYFKNSCEWQRRVRKYCFESVRRSKNLAGYDFLGPIDTHWHTFGYSVGMMNEFYELKPSETVRNVRMYNAPTVLLHDMGMKANYESGQALTFGVYVSHFGANELCDAELNIKLICGETVVCRQRHILARIPVGEVQKQLDCTLKIPFVEAPTALKLSITLDGADTFAENEWELYAFPKVTFADTDEILLAGDMREDEWKAALQQGKTVLFMGKAPFVGKPTSFRIALAGRAAGNLATVIYDHPLTRTVPHEGFCGWQFQPLLEGGSAVCFHDDTVPFHPIIEVVSTHKFAIRQAALFEFGAYSGKALVCTFRFDPSDPAARWLQNELIRYARSEDFHPRDTLDERQLNALLHGEVINVAQNVNFALNPNDKTAVRKK